LEIRLIAQQLLQMRDEPGLLLHGQARELHEVHVEHMGYLDLGLGKGRHEHLNESP
jgi:hypothetical protein